MDWNGSFRPFLARPPESSFNLFCNYYLDQYPDMKNETMGTEEAQGLFTATEICSYGGLEKKKRLSSDQLESLERSFQEEIKLDPERKIKLSQELGLQPRQIAVWFQNRRARWKAKQLERLYDALRQDYDIVSREKLKLQEEVVKLKSMLREQAGKDQMSAIFTDISGEETEESTSVTRRGSQKTRVTTTTNAHRQIGECNYVYSVDDYNQVVAPPVPPFWPPGAVPSYPQ